MPFVDLLKKKESPDEVPQQLSVSLRRLLGLPDSASVNPAPVPDEKKSGFSMAQANLGLWKPRITYFPLLWIAGDYGKFPEGFFPDDYDLLVLEIRHPFHQPTNEFLRSIDSDDDDYDWDPECGFNHRPRTPREKPKPDPIWETINFPEEIVQSDGSYDWELLSKEDMEKIDAYARKRGGLLPDFEDSDDGAENKKVDVEEPKVGVGEGKILQFNKKKKHIQKYIPKPGAKNPFLETGIDLSQLHSVASPRPNWADGSGPDYRKPFNIPTDIRAIVAKCNAKAEKKRLKYRKYCMRRSGKQVQAKDKLVAKKQNKSAV